MSDASSVLDPTKPPSNARLLLEEKPSQFGPVTSRLLIRSGLMLLSIFLVGVLLTFGTDSDVFRAAGLSLIFPGGGFLFVGWPSLFLLTIVAMFFAILLWWGLSAFFTIPLVWVVSSVGSAALVNGPRLWSEPGVIWIWAIPFSCALYLSLAATALFRSYMNHRGKVQNITGLNEYLRTAPEPQASKPSLEPNEMDRELLGWLYELALQPADEFEGYDWGEQYHGGTCLRYQLSFLGEGMAAYAVNALPNHLQMIEPAMASLVERMTDQRVWKYWQLENFLSTGRTNPDPIIDDNVMLTGFLQSQLSLFEAATGSHKFDEPGSLKFVWKDGQVFSYDHKTLCEAIVDNLERSAFGLYSCEPTWVFTVCNTQAAQGLIGYDRVHGTNYWGRVSDRFRSGLIDEMMTADGAFRHIRTNVFGFSFNDGDGLGEYYTTGTHNFEDIAPDLALRGKVLSLKGVKEKMATLEKMIVDGFLNLPFVPKRERATYIMSSLMEWAGVVGGARAVGNETVAAAATRSMERACGTGKRFPDRPLSGGVQSIAITLFTRWARPLSLGQITLRGYVPPIGPVIEYAPWPEVIVTKARSEDGSNLDFVVEPYKGDKSAVHEFVFSSMEPNTAYRLKGGNFDEALVADEKGSGKFNLQVASRLDLKLELRGA